MWATSAGSLPITRGSHQLYLTLSRETKPVCLCVHLDERVEGIKKRTGGGVSVVLVLGSNLRNSRLVGDTKSQGLEEISGDQLVKPTC